MIANEELGTHKFIQDKNGKVKINTYGKTLQKYGIRVVGSRALDEWFQVNTAAFQFLSVYYDNRLRNGSNVPGLPAYFRVLENGDLGLKLLTTQWNETNKQ